MGSRFFASFRKDPSLSRLRQDPLTGRWVIIATGRGARPNEFPLQRRSADGAGDCPFCPGHEDQTTPEVLALGRSAGAPPNGPGWHLRVFPNMYPAVRPRTGAPADDEGADADDLLRQDAGVGRHEVIVYSPRHADGPADLDAPAMAGMLRVLRGRAREFAADPDVRFVAPFCNHGPEAGATLAHPHLQIIGAPRVPLLTVDKVLRAARHETAHGSCLLCDLADRERAEGERVVAADARWTVLAPWASRFPWEMLLIPRRHAPCLADADDDELAALGDVLGRALRSLRDVHGDLSLNIVVHTAPRRAGPEGTYGDPELDGCPLDPHDHHHWHVEILPRLSRQAGFEAGTGYAINAVAPEEAARRLRAGMETT
jgi:UDPglucose--hexose-1-phosphate uridylyltransferase